MHIVYKEKAGVQGRHDTVEVWLQSIYHEHFPSLYRYALTLTGSMDDAQDAVQEVFTRISREWKRFMDVQNVRAYLYCATRNAAYGILRSRKRREVLHEAICMDLAAACAPHAKQTSATIISIRSAFSQLTIEQHEVLVLKILNQMTFKEIAETMGVPLNTVAGRYRYGIEKLRLALNTAE